jgi:protein CpxP
MVWSLALIVRTLIDHHQTNGAVPHRQGDYIMKKSLLVITVLTAALIGGLFFTSAQVNAAPAGDPPKWERGERPEKGERFLARMTKTLDLSAEQQEKIKAIMDEHRNKVAPLRQDLDENRDKLRQATKADTFDEAAIRTLAAGQAAAKTELVVERARMMSQIHAVLTPEQRKLADEKMERMMERRGGDRHHGKKCK